MESHPVMIYATLIVGVLLVISQAVPKILGPIGTALQGWSQRRREARIEARSADLVDIQRQVEYLTEQRKIDRAEHAREKAEQERENEQLKREFDQYRSRWAAREERWRQEWAVHRRWDYDALEALIGRQPPFDPSPPFMTPDPPTPERDEP